MAKDKTPSFVLTLKLNTSEFDDRALASRFYYAFLIKNRLIRHVRRALSSMRQDKEYRYLIKELYDLGDKRNPD